MANSNMIRNIHVAQNYILAQTEKVNSEGTYPSIDYAFLALVSGLILDIESQ